MKFSSSYEPNQFEPDIYAAWEAAGVFNPTVSTVPVDADGNGHDDRLESEENAFSEHVWRRAKHGASEPRNDGSELAFRKSISSDSTYSIVMPPPNANGNLHIGHGLTVALEDSLTRYYRLKGKSTWYIPGADHAGFETWVVYERALEASGHTRFEYDRNELYARVWDFVAQQRGNMEVQLRALGASCAWNDLTFTLDENVVDRVYTTFEKMWNDGLIYRGKKLVNYCPKHQTAFADIEVEHQAVYSQEVDTARQKGFGQETEITSRVVVGGKVNGKTRHCVRRAIRNCQHRVQRGKVANRVGRILADTDNQIRIQRRVIARLSGAERHLHVVYRQRRVERILQHSPCLTGAVQVEDTCKVSAIDII